MSRVRRIKKSSRPGSRAKNDHRNYFHFVRANRLLHDWETVEDTNRVVIFKVMKRLRKRLVDLPGVIAGAWVGYEIMQASVGVGGGSDRRKSQRERERCCRKGREGGRKWEEPRTERDPGARASPMD